MPLTRPNVTAASRIMLPTYPIFCLVVAINLLFTPDARLAASPGLQYASLYPGLTYWGLGFLVVGAVMTYALIVHERRTYQVGLGIAIVWLSLWAAVLAFAAIFSDASPTSWVWPLFVARACYASLVSLEVRER